jgi:hypothetical protein
VVTADVPDYRANPARLAEQVAIPIVRRWLGGGGTLFDDSGSGARFDYTIEYGDGRRADGDVWLDADETLSATWGDLVRQREHHVIELSRAAGTWSLGLTHDARGKVVRGNVPSLVDAALANGITDLDFEQWWSPPGLDPAVRSVFEKGRALGITYLTRQDARGRDVAIYFPMTSPRPQATDSDTLREWIQDVFARPAGRKHLEKLLSSKADERHAFVVAHNATPSSIQMTLATLSVAEPSLVVPEGITHVWVLPRSVDAAAGLWTEADGWRIIER